MQLWFNYSNDGRFGVHIHHGGYFAKIGRVEYYIGGTVVPRFDLDGDKFGYFDLEDEVQKLGYMSWNRIKFKVPNMMVYKDIHSDKEVMEMLGYLCKTTRVLDLFVVES